MQPKKIIAGVIAGAMLTGSVSSLASADEAEVLEAEITMEEPVEEAVTESIEVETEEVVDEQEILEEAIIPSEEIEEISEKEVEESEAVAEESVEEVSVEETEAELSAEDETEETTEAADPVEENVADETTEEAVTEEVAVEAVQTEKTLENEENISLFSEEEVSAASEENEPEISDYETFMMYLPLLEELAQVYVTEFPGPDPTELVIKYIRTGVDRYNSGSWGIMAGYEDANFAAFVQMMQDDLNSQLPEGEGYYITSLKNINPFILPNGDRVDFGHMFGTMDITNHNKSSLNHADVGGWAGDLVDLLSTADRHAISGSMEDMVAEIREKYLAKNINESDVFGESDMYGDLDAMYVMNTYYASNGEKLLSEIIGEYFTEELSDEFRAEYFIKNRLDGETKRTAMRDAVYKEYTGNKVVSTLEATREFVSGNVTELRKACCYAFADYICELAGDWVELKDNRYYSVFSSEISTLAPGVSQEVKYAMTADNQQIVYYIATADIGRDDVNVYANYNNNDGSSWEMSRVQDQMAAAQAKHSDPDSEHYIKDYNAIVGVNGDFFNMQTGEPSGVLVMEGVQYHAPNSNYFFSIMKDGTAFIGNKSDWESVKDNVQEAIGGSALLVKDGESVIAHSDSYTANRASRTCVGITKTGKVVLMVLDGRQALFSAGGAYQELAQIMLDAGCVTAINLDGGGSSTFAAKQEGEDEVTIVNRPSDGFARSVSSSLLVVSTAPSSTAFDHAVIESDYDYVTVGAPLQLTAEGVSATGNKAEMPEGYTWEIPEELTKWGEITQDGVFTAKRLGDVEVRLVLDGTVIGTKTIHAVLPDKIRFTRDKLDVVYGAEVTLPLAVSYEGKSVKVQESDIVLSLANDASGTLDGFTFTGSSAGGIKVATITASLAYNTEISAQFVINMYNQGEATFDFDQATAGDRQLAWTRTVSNTVTTDDIKYEVIDAEKTPEASYVFALDMTQIPIPEVLEELTTMLPGSDLEGATAWTFLLSLAERVSTLTEVKPVVKFDKNFTVDYSNLKVVNEYFTLKEVVYNEEENSLALTLKWIDQPAAIDPATANSMCILSGVKLIPKADAVWTDNQLTAEVEGDVTYDIYLRANALYTFASKPENQEAFNLYPFVNPELPSETGGHFASTYKEFNDTFTLDKNVKSGWVNISGDRYYYQDGEKLTGIQILPDVDGSGTDYCYNLGTDGALKGLANGLFELNGDKYYALNGELQKGWRLDFSGTEDQYYFFDWKTYKAVDGVQTIEGYEYVFENNVLVRGAWQHNENGIRYRWAGTWRNQGWFTLDGKDYYAARSGYVLTEITSVKAKATGEFALHVFDSNGVWQSQYNGFYQEEDGDTYLVENGIVLEHPGLQYVDGSYYYFGRNNKMLKNGSYWLSNMNGLLDAGTYYFGADGRMDWKEGLIFDEDGEIRYYENNAAQSPGLVTDGNGNYYYIGAAKKAVKSTWYVFSNASGNGLMPGGEYWFREDGTMQLKDGLYFEKNGDIRYYVNHTLHSPGLVTDGEGNYYYIGARKKAAKSTWYAFSDGSGNGLMPGGEYWFDETGKMELKDGLYFEKNGDIRYYVNYEAQAAGLVVDDNGDYYYIGVLKKALKSKTVAVTEEKANGLMPAGEYWFDETGKLLIQQKEGLVLDADGEIRYYVNNEAQYAGLVTDGEGNYYYINSTKKAVKNRTYTIGASKTNGLMPAGTYYFGADGKMQLN